MFRHKLPFSVEALLPVSIGSSASVHHVQKSDQLDHDLTSLLIRLMFLYDPIMLLQNLDTAFVIPGIRSVKDTNQFE